MSACGAASVGSPPKTVRVADYAAAATNPITVSPLPGTGDASPTTQISFLGGPATTVSHVSVVGSSSGSHSGKLEPYSTGTGEVSLGPALAAIGNAVYNATGVRIRQLPMTPAVVLAALNQPQPSMESL